MGTIKKYFMGAVLAALSIMIWFALLELLDKASAGTGQKIRVFWLNPVASTISLINTGALPTSS